MVGHCENMQKDLVDFFWCAMKRVNLATYCESHETREKIHQGKWPVKACIELLRLLARMRRDVDVQSEVESVQKTYDAHKSTPEYAKWLKDLDEKADDHYIRGDRDPDGYEVYMAAL